MPACLLWDFGDTLCDERFIWGAGPEWMAIYETFDDGLGAEWSLGELTTVQFARELALRMNKPEPEVLEHITRRSRMVEFFPQTYAFFRAHHLPQAIVTVNPDLFSEIIAPHYDFAAVTETIVTSWEERSLDKGTLCAIALERLGVGCAPSDALLIDNRQDCLDSWAARGGAGWLHTSDAAFAQMAPALLAESAG